MPHSLNNQWQPCFADPWRGVAHFDGLTIEADPVTSGIPQRVLPCIQDEQIYFCRMVRALIPDGEKLQGKKAVDLGTGSGVLALYAAALGMKVTGIDRCERALDFANYNLLLNRAILPAGPESVRFLQGDWTSQSLLEPFANNADYILFNPPFGPHLDGHRLPLCASGGHLGQDAFLAILPLAFSLLAPGGRLFAIHLLLTDHNGNPKCDLLTLTGLPNTRWASARIFPAISGDPINALEVLNRQGPASTSTTPIGLDDFFLWCSSSWLSGRVPGKMRSKPCLPT